MFHGVQVNQAARESGYDFTDSFIHIKDFIHDADLAIGNYESSSNPNLAPSDYPRFNTPASSLDAIKEVGFDCLATANNHSLDTGPEGISTSLDAIGSRGLVSFGSFNPDYQDFGHARVGSLDIGLLAYTDSLNGLEGELAGYDEVGVNTLWDEDKVKEDIQELKNTCDLVIVYPHWGQEYQSYPTDRQVDLAKLMADWGADIIIGSHPHVVQPAEIYLNSRGKETFVAYSCGNFLSAQNLENNGDIRVEQGICYEIEVVKNLTKDQVYIESVKAHPLWVGRGIGQEGPCYQVHLCSDYLGEGPGQAEIDPASRERIQTAYDMTMETIDYFEYKKSENHQ